jgi:hypothetical protein
MAQEFTGGCACGAVRYRLASVPTDAGWCHCRTCQLNSGSPAMAFAKVPIGDFIFTAGEALVSQFASSDFGHRRFCSKCGTPLMMVEDEAPTSVDFSLATLDDPAGIVPGFHLYYTSHIPWAPAADHTPRYPRSRRNSTAMQQSQQQQ